MMPGIDGLALCERLKRRAETAHIPVLLITSLSDRAVRLRGIASGANDFLVKPIDTQDIALRVRNAIRLKRMFDRMREANERQTAAELLRDNLVHMIVPDLRSPLFTIRLYLEAFLGESAGVERELRLDIEKALAVSGGMAELIGSILDISRFEAGEMPLSREPCVLAGLCDEALATVRGLAGGKRLTIAAQDVTVSCDRALMRRALANLLGNACKHARSSVEIGGRATDAGVEIWVLDDGPGVPAAARARTASIARRPSPWRICSPAACGPRARTSARTSSSSARRRSTSGSSRSRLRCCSGLSAVMRRRSARAGATAAAPRW
jgi:signal transduction histidine kinase